MTERAKAGIRDKVPAAGRRCPAFFARVQGKGRNLIEEFKNEIPHPEGFGMTNKGKGVNGEGETAHESQPLRRQGAIH